MADLSDTHRSPVTPAEDMRTMALHHISWGAVVGGVFVALSLFFMILDYPDGKTAQYNLGLLIIGGALCVLAAVSLHRVDPLPLMWRARLRPPTPEADVVPVEIERPRAEIRSG